MAFTAAAAGFLVCLLSVQVIQCQDTWGVIYASPTVCAFKGSTVHMNCTYSHPSDQNLRKAFWYVDKQKKTPLKDDPEYRDRVEYVCVEKTCTLRITDLRESDSKEYLFRFLTTDDVFSGSPGVVLSVTDVHMQVTKVKVEPSYTEAELSCQSSDQNPYVWIKNGQKVPGDAASYTGRFYPGDSISCASMGSEDCPTPPLYAPKVPSVSVSPSGEIVEGSSVNLTCSRDANIVANYSWYKNQEYVFLSQDPQLVFSSIQSSDSGEYHCTAENQLGGRKSPNISVNVKYGPKHLNVSVSPSAEIVEGSSVTLTCSSDANPAASYTWFKENQTLISKDPQLVFSSIQSSDSGEYHCEAENQLGSRTSGYTVIDVKYAPRLPSVSVSPSAEIVEGSSVTLTCSSDANPAASYTWIKENQTLFEGPEGIYHFPSINSKDSGNYYCKSENQHGEINSSSIFLDVQYAPRLPSVSVSPSAEIVEGSSVNLTCSSDANPAASYTWFKENQKLFQGPEGKYNFPSISSEDRGNYYCKSENQHGESSSTSLFLDVQYAPKRPFMSVCPSAEIVEGSSVTLTCSSDANPAASYTWFKEDEDSPKVSGQIFIISDFRAEHRGNYSCEAWNSRGIRRSNLHLTVRNGEWVFIVAGTVSATLVAVILISVFLWIRKKRAPKPPSEPEESPETNAQKPATEQKERLHYASIHFSQKQADPVNTSSSPAEAQREEPVERVEYATVIFNSASTG